MNFGLIVKVELKGFPDGLDLKCKRNRKVKDNTKVLGLI